MKPVWKSKTAWFNLLTIVVAVLAVPEVLAVIPLDWMPYLMAVNGVVNVFLRLITVSPLRT